MKLYIGKFDCNSIDSHLLKVYFEKSASRCSLKNVKMEKLSLKNTLFFSNIFPMYHYLLEAQHLFELPVWEG